MLRVQVWCALAVALATAVLGQRVSYDYGFDTSRFVRRQSASQVFVVSGATATNQTSLSVRREIRDMEQDHYSWTLYLLSLSMFQYVDQDQMLSYYQVAGIHGVPFVNWDGVQPTAGNQNSGYCKHLSILFPTWHRAYLALYEQILANFAQQIASYYPDGNDKQHYVNAAANFRIPYWDWAATPPEGDSVLPDSVGGSPVVNVSGPNGAQVISNPLYSYEFKPLDPSAFIESPWSVYPETVRSPTTQNASAQSNDTMVLSVLDQNQASFQQRLYNMLSSDHNFSTFSNEGWIPDTSNSSYDSLESLHDTIHTLCGMQGHMSFIPFSAFDPIFFLHHAMVDRAFAMWQVLNPQSWVVPTAAVMNSYTTSVGQIEDSKTALTPFYATSNGSFWSSDMVRNPAVFGYTYPEIAGFERNERTASKRSSVIKAINRLYGTNSPASLSSIGAQSGRWTSALEAEKRSASKPRIRGRQNAPASHPPSCVDRIIVNGQYREWIANVRVKKQAVNGPFSVLLFLDSVPADPQTWSHAASLVGTMSIFATPPGFANADMARSHLSTGTVPLTAALVDRVFSGALSNLEPESVQPYLEQELMVRVALANGTQLDAQDVEGLAVSIVSSEVDTPTSDEDLPHWGSMVSHFDLV